MLLGLGAGAGVGAGAGAGAGTPLGTVGLLPLPPLSSLLLAPRKSPGFSKNRRRMSGEYLSLPSWTTS